MGSMSNRRTFLKLLAVGLGSASRHPALKPFCRYAAASLATQRPLDPGHPKIDAHLDAAEGGLLRGAVRRRARGRLRGHRDADRYQGRGGGRDPRGVSQKTGLRVHSVMNEEHWRSPLSSSDPEVVNRSVRGMESVDSQRDAVGIRYGPAGSRRRRRHARRTGTHGRVRSESFASGSSPWRAMPK